MSQNLIQITIHDENSVAVSYPYCVMHFGEIVIKIVV